MAVLASRSLERINQMIDDDIPLSGGKINDLMVIHAEFLEWVDTADDGFIGVIGVSGLIDVLPGAGLTASAGPLAGASR